MSALLKADDNVLSVLRDAEMDDDGLVLVGQLSRPDYVAVNKFLAMAGAKWNRGQGKHLFTKPDTRKKIEALLCDGEMLDEKKHFQAFYTPDDLAKQVIDMALIYPGMTVLEPSAGVGALAKLAFKKSGQVSCVEMNPEAAKTLSILGFAPAITDFLSMDPDVNRFDRVVMNPPFTRGQDIKHILHALKFLKPNGLLVAICANGPKQQEKLKPIVEASGGQWKELPSCSFKEAGTNVNTVILTINT